jgi:hypothetical protein
VDAEVTPQPEPDERDAIEAALRGADPPEPSPWWRAGLGLDAEDDR